MRYSLVLISVTLFFLSCSTQNTKPIKSTYTDSDTIEMTNGLKPEKHVPIDYYDFSLTLDTLNFEKELISLLHENENKPKFRVDSLIIDGLSCQGWFFGQGHLFSKKREHALVFINSAEYPIFIFEKNQNEWYSIKRIEHGRPEDEGEKTIDLRDINYDGVVDLAIHHGDFGGHYSGYSVTKFRYIRMSLNSFFINF